MTELFAGDVANAGRFRCLHCRYVLDLATQAPLPSCPSCGHADWRRLEIDPLADDTAAEAPAAAASPSGARSGALALARYGAPTLLVLLGVISLAVNLGGFGVEGFGLFVGAGLSILLLNVLFRLGVQSDADRDREEAARAFYAEHGRWPDEA
jgi:hypothetical protein